MILFLVLHKLVISITKELIYLNFSHDSDVGVPFSDPLLRNKPPPSPPTMLQVFYAIFTIFMGFTHGF